MPDLELPVNQPTEACLQLEKTFGARIVCHSFPKYCTNW